MERQGEDNERQSKPFSHLGELLVDCLSLALGKECLGAACDGTGQTGALAALHEDDDGNNKSGKNLQYCQYEKPVHYISTLSKYSVNQ